MKVGDILDKIFICNDCLYSEGVNVKKPYDSGKKSFLCRKCGHFGIGSYYKCLVSKWLELKVIK